MRLAGQASTILHHFRWEDAMAFTIPFAARRPALTMDEFGAMLSLQPHQIRAVLYPACATAELIADPPSSPVGARERLERLVRACADTGCPPCMRRATEGLSLS